MKARFFSASLVALMAWTTWAQAQGALGTPIANDGRFESKYSSYPAPASVAECNPDCKPKPAHPIWNNFARRFLTPIRTATGPMMPPSASVEIPTKDDLARMIAAGDFSPAEISAAKIKIDEAQGATRRAAVKYLGTIDCHYYPEAEYGLVAALRADRIESVRYEAALAMASCRGLTPRMLEALQMTALGSDFDGNPAETSDQVRAAARGALGRAAGVPTAYWQPALPAPNWYAPDPSLIQPTSYFPPPYAPADMPAYVPTMPPVAKQDREVAQSVSAHSPSPPASASSSRPFFHFLRGLLPTREASTSRDFGKNVDPRMRGIAPLGSEVNLAIPSLPSTHPVTSQSVLPYNREQ
jgi:hypothetical protein